MTIKTPTERNIEALKEVRERILANQLYMPTWVQFSGPLGLSRYYEMQDTFMGSVVTEETVDACGTKACLAGWAIINEAIKAKRTYGRVLMGHMTEVGAGAALLGLDYPTAMRVFTESWPLDLQWEDPDHQLAMIDGLIAGWYIDDLGQWHTADGEPLTTDAL